MFPIQSSLAQKSIEHVYVGAQKFGTVIENNFIGCVQVSKLTSKFEPRHEKTNILVSDLVQHKPGCTATKKARSLKFRF